MPPVYNRERFEPMAGSKRFTARAGRAVNRDSFIQEWPETGLILFYSPYDPRPQIRIGAGRIVELDGKPESQFDMLDRFIARHAIDVSVAEEAMAHGSRSPLRACWSISPRRGEAVVRIVERADPADDAWKWSGA